MITTHPRGPALLLAAALTTTAISAWARDITVPGDFTRIQAAIEASKTGDTILVTPGTYPERLTLKPGITLRSVGENTKGRQGLRRAETTILAHPDGTGPGVTMAEGSRLDGFTITGVGQYDEVLWTKHHATQGEQQESRHIGAAGTPGVAVAHTCEVVHNIVHHIGYTGIAITGAEGREVEPLVAHNTCYRNMGGGIGIMGGANPILTQNTCYENFHAGIGFSGARGTLKHNHCYRNIRAGIGISENSSPTLEQNHCHHNRRAGIGIRTGAGTRPKVINNLCTDNDMAGIGAKQKARPLLIGNTCLRNKLAGIGCKEDANATITANTCKDNALAGIGLDGAHATLTKNRCEGNGTAALGLQDGATATATENNFIAKTVVAIGVRNGSKLTATGNQISRKGGMPPLVAVLEKSTLALTDNQLEGGGVAALLLQGQATLTGNTLLGNALRKGGPPNFSAWVKAGSTLEFNGNKVSGWRHAVHAEKPEAITARQNQITNFHGTAIVIHNSSTAATVTGNTAWSSEPNASVVQIIGDKTNVSGNKLLPGN